MTDYFSALSVVPLLEDDCFFSRALTSLPPDRKERILRIKPARERCLSLGGFLLLAEALRERGILDPSFGYGEFGKPYLTNAPQVHFNISHAGDYAVCAASDVPVGCDIERMRPFRFELAERVLAPEELVLLNEKMNDGESASLFFRFWTLKESFLKAVGCGITVPLASVSFDLANEVPVVMQQLSEAAYCFREYDALPGYCCALCKKGGGPLPPLTVKKYEKSEGASI